MVEHNFSKATPYKLPKNTQKAINYLAKILKLNPSLVKNGDDKLLQALCGTIIYRHLDRLQRIEVMTIIRSLPNRRLGGQLVGRITDVLYVNPRWGVWSLSTRELNREMKSNADFQYVMLVVGVAGGKDVAKSVSAVWKARTLASKNTLHLIANLVIWGVAYGSYREGVKLTNEWKRRHIRANSVIIVPEK